MSSPAPGDSNPPLGPSNQSSTTPPAGSTAAPGSARRETWRSPAGISAIAAAITCVLGVVTFLFVDLVARPNAAPPGGAPAPASPASPSTDAGLLVFVYGTSMPGRSLYGAIDKYVESQRPAEVNGYLYDTGAGYPAAKFGTGDPIPGYVLTLRAASAQEFFTEMTRIEAGLYDLVPVTTSEGVRARAYEWLGPTDGFQRIPRWTGS